MPLIEVSYTPAQLAELKRPQLQALCKSNNLPANLKSSVLVEQLTVLFAERVPATHGKSISFTERVTEQEADDELLLVAQSSSKKSVNKGKAVAQKPLAGPTNVQMDAILSRLADLTSAHAETVIELKELRGAYDSTVKELELVRGIASTSQTRSEALAGDMESLRTKVNSLEDEARKVAVQPVPTPTAPQEAASAIILPAVQSTINTALASPLPPPRVSALLGKHPRYSDSSFASDSEASFTLPPQASASTPRPFKSPARTIMPSPASGGSGHARKRARTVSPPSTPEQQPGQNEVDEEEEHRDEELRQESEESSDEDISYASTTVEDRSFTIPTKAGSSPAPVASTSTFTAPQSPFIRPAMRKLPSSGALNAINAPAVSDPSFFANHSPAPVRVSQAASISPRKSLPMASLPFPLVSKSPAPASRPFAAAPASAPAPFSSVGNTITPASPSRSRSPKSAEMVRSAAINPPGFMSRRPSMSASASSRPQLFNPSTSTPSSMATLTFQPARRLPLSKSPRKSLVFPAPTSSSLARRGSVSVPSTGRKTALVPPPTPQAYKTMYGSEREEQRFGDDLGSGQEAGGAGYFSGNDEEVSAW